MKACGDLKQLENSYLKMNGLGLLEITELRGSAGSFVDGCDSWEPRGRRIAVLRRRGEVTGFGLSGWIGGSDCL
jgi:hypothetical protein